MMTRTDTVRRVLVHAARAYVQGLADSADPWLEDPRAFAQRAGFRLDRWQQDVLASTAPQIAMNCSRQSGKSTTAAFLAVRTALRMQGALVLLVAPAIRQAQELYRKCRDVLAALGPDAPRTRQESALWLEFASTRSRS